MQYAINLGYFQIVGSGTECKLSPEGHDFKLIRGNPQWPGGLDLFSKF